ncbi:hypothetical protein I553_8218 [Mycobacterium xenopi 4042]|uniref:Uncharacterized protein n=1 Tax=Mycobacterium xenopi 4042 TaxID=1299334 RepID=X8BJ55_MYCXE|nr:hypothetical protein I552_7884 [Mycobacterium xenopi 3993]EUA43884.1 hypothetical protein I553_8218 [Mycobacterium xenopi 4042]
MLIDHLPACARICTAILTHGRRNERRALLRRPRGGPGVRLGAGGDADGRDGRGSPGHRGDRLRLPLDADLSAAVTGAPAALAHPGLVWDVAIGQTTLATQRVKANLFYRGLVFHRFPVIGDTLYTRTEVVGLRANRPKPGRAPTGLTALRMTTIDQADRLVLDFYRCAMLPASPGGRPTRSGPATTCPASAPTRRHRPMTRPPTGTPRRFADECPARILTPVWPARCCTAAPTWSAAHPSWPVSPSISLPHTMIHVSAGVGWSTADIPSGWRSPRPRGCCRTW